LIKKIYIDIDGVMTNGNKIYDGCGRISYKEYNDKDFSAIRILRNLGIDVIFISGDRNINENMATRRKIPFIYSRNKVTTVRELEGDIKEFIAYIGDDIPDIPLLKEVYWSFCPADASPFVKHCTKYILKTNGGEGVIAELFWNICNFNDIKIDNISSFF